VKKEISSMQTEMRFDFKGLWCYVIYQLKKEVKNKNSNHKNLKIE